MIDIETLDVRAPPKKTNKARPKWLYIDIKAARASMAEKG